MSYSSNAVIRRALQERLSSVGLCPDLKNDEAAVNQLCEQMGLSREEVSRELALMRVEKGESLLHRMSLSAAVPTFLASVSSTRNLLAARPGAKPRASFMDEYRRRSSLSSAELIADLDMFDRPAFQNERRDRRQFETPVR